jgi:MFS family permease
MIGGVSVARLPAPLAAVAAVVHNRSLRRVLLAFIGFSMAEWGTWIAILVYAYGRGGAAETGVAALIQLAPSAVVAPIAASLGDHVRRDRALLLAYVVQAFAMGCTAAALLAAVPAPIVYLCAAAAATSVTLTRPIQAAILPSLARAPAELTAANVAAGTVETASIVVGPILAGLTLALAGPGVVFGGAALVLLAGSALVAGIRPFALAAHPVDQARGGWRAMAGETLSGFRVLITEPRPRAVLGLLGAASVLWGVLDVLLVVLAVDLLLIGEAGVGYLNSALGVGGLMGAALSALLIGRSRLATPFAAAIVLWSLPLMLLGLLPGLPAALLLIAAAGIGRVIMDVAGRTLLQRVAPDHSLARTFGVLEGMHMASLALGSVLAPLLILVGGKNGAFAISGASVLVLLLLLRRPLRQIDTLGVARPRELTLLRSIPIFAPLGAVELEQLAANLLPVHAHAGSTIIQQGQLGDYFYIVVDGEVDVEIDGRHVRRLGSGESFGEIALLRDVPRTATVRAVNSSELLALERGVFMEAVTGQPSSHAVADAIASALLATQPEEADASA